MENIRYANGVNVAYSLDTNIFSVGDAYEFHQGANNFYVAILQEIDVKRNKLSFISLNGELVVKLNSIGNFEIVTCNENCSVSTVPAHFRKLSPSYDNKDEFNWDN